MTTVAQPVNDKLPTGTQTTTTTSTTSQTMTGNTQTQTPITQEREQDTRRPRTSGKRPRTVSFGAKGRPSGLGGKGKGKGRGKGLGKGHRIRKTAKIDTVGSWLGKIKKASIRRMLSAAEIHRCQKVVVPILRKWWLRNLKETSRTSGVTTSHAKRSTMNPDDLKKGYAIAERKTPRLYGSFDRRPSTVSLVVPYKKKRGSKRKMSTPEGEKMSDEENEVEEDEGEDENDDENDEEMSSDSDN